MTYDDYITAIQTLIPGTDLPLNDQHYVLAVNKALKLHSKYKPRRIVEEVAGETGIYDYALSDLDAWEPDFSQMIQVEYPVDDTKQEPTILDRDKGDWFIYDKPAGSFLRFVSECPVTGESMRLTYTGLHAVDALGNLTVATSDHDAVQVLAASFACRILAAAYAQNQDSTIQADSVDQTSKRREYETQAKRYRDEYNELMGIEPGKPKAATVVKNQDTTYPWGGDRLTHPLRWR